MIYVKFFAKYREILGLAEEGYDLGVSPVSVDILKAAIRERHSGAIPMLEDVRCIVAINQQVAGGDTLICDGDEVAFFPPVTGG